MKQPPPLQLSVQAQADAQLTMPAQEPSPEQSMVQGPPLQVSVPLQEPPLQPILQLPLQLTLFRQEAPEQVT